MVRRGYSHGLSKGEDKGESEGGDESVGVGDSGDEGNGKCQGEVVSKWWCGWGEGKREG